MPATTGRDAPHRNETTMDLEGDRGLVIKRAFNAPAHIVFDAWTRADLVKLWWAPKSLGVSIVSCEADVRVGGRYRYVLQPRSGQAFAFSGTYTTVTPHTQLTYTQVFEPMAAGGEAIVAITFEERHGKTYMVSHETYPSAEVRKVVLDSGMEQGMRETMDQLDDLVAELGGQLTPRQ